jgi:5-methylcytosine-specific restriction protein A
MKFTKANLALRDHAANGEDVYLFEEVHAKSGYLRYRGQMVCTGYEFVTAPDTDQNMRKAILFELTPIEGLNGREADETSEDTLDRSALAELRAKALADSAACRTAVERRALLRMRSRAVRLYVLRRAAGRCEACGSNAPFLTDKKEPYLEPHHIRRLTDGGPDHPSWVAGLCPNCHRRAHYAADAAEFNLKLEQIVSELEVSQRSPS